MCNLTRFLRYFSFSAINFALTNDESTLTILISNFWRVWQISVICLLFAYIDTLFDVWNWRYIFTTFTKSLAFSNRANIQFWLWRNWYESNWEIQNCLRQTLVKNRFALHFRNLLFGIGTNIKVELWKGDHKSSALICSNFTTRKQASFGNFLPIRLEKL